MKSYSYPIETYWNHQEMATVISLWNAVEKAYEAGIPVEDFLQAYKDFKSVVPAKGEERALARQFEDLSGYSLYQVHKAATTTSKKILKMETGK